MTGTDKRRKAQLGMTFGRACSILRKQILFSLLKINNLNFCFRCKKEIIILRDLSIEHKQPWLDVSPELFWDLNNIAFSHLSCNCSQRNKETHAHLLKHGCSGYENRACRCEICKEYKRKKNAKRVR